MNAEFLRREGDRVELAVKSRYENPTPDFTGDGEQRLNDIPAQHIWVQPGNTTELTVAGLASMDFAGDFIDHKPPTFFSPEDTVDPKTNEFRIVSPVLIRDQQVVFNERGASSMGEAKPGTGVIIYRPGEGRFLFSPAPFKDGVEGSVIESQVLFHLDGKDYVLLTAVPPTRAEHLWVKHEPQYKPSDRRPDAEDDKGFLGGGGAADFPTE
jgi:hypothetical protein